MPELPKVSVVTPSLNPGPVLLEETIQSVLSQTYPHIEFIVMDGGSTDGSLDVLRKYERDLKWVSEPDRGQSDALVKGFEKSHGEILTWLNADDLLEPWAVEHAVEALLVEPDFAVVYGAVLYIGERGQVLERHDQPPRLSVKSLILGDQYLVQPGTFFWRDDYFRVGGLNVSLHYVMDFDLWLRMLSGQSSKGHPEIWARHRMTHSNKTIAASHRFWPEICQILRKLEGNLPADVTEQDWRESLARAHLRAGLELARVGAVSEGTLHLIQALQMGFPFGGLTNTVYYTLGWLENVRWRKPSDRSAGKVLLDILEEASEREEGHHIVGYLHAALALQCYREENPLQAWQHGVRALLNDSRTWRSAKLWQVISRAMLGRRCLQVGRGLKQAFRSRYP